MSTLVYPPRVQVALLPTRIERLARYGGTLSGVEIWIKRDDQTGFLLSGNKIRKLEFSFARALAEGVHGVVTCGGVNSNHCRGTAALAARLGIEAHLFLRTADGAAPDKLSGNTLLDQLLGARIEYITPDDYRRRDEIMKKYAERCALDGLRLFVIPEGASDAIGAFGYVNAVEEIQSQLSAKNLQIDYLVHAMGSGGTTAGLCAGREQFSASWQVIGFPVCDDEQYFRDKVASIRSDLVPMGLPEPQGDHGLIVIDDYKGRGYGLTTEQELRWLRDFCRLEGILLDPCYSGKAFYGMHQEILAGRFPPGSKILFLHTGGGFGNYAYADEWARVID